MTQYTRAGWNTIEDTGERMLPERADENTFWNHIYRYRFAMGLVSSKDVMDIACGEGYGTAILKAAGARTIVGVDIAPAVCEHAARKYAIDTRVGSCLGIPAEANSLDVVVSFETLEHLDSPAGFLAEVRRVLRPGGLLVVSTPNSQVTEETDHSNPFHVREFTRVEFTELLSNYFENVRLFSQYTIRCSILDHRSLSAQRSAWGRVPGYWRSRLFLARRLCGHIVGDDVRAEYRANPVAQALTADRFGSTLVNPYVVRSWREPGSVVPAFIIATATKSPH